ncbi:MAG: glycosyltransferase family 39 protein [Anaerolineales bacterium]|nr:glycosyltransferase family 39 protein [Anaerolineales bacterium]
MQSPLDSASRAPARAAKLILLALIMLIGAFFRLYQIGTIPPGDGFDPAYYGLDALRILAGEHPIYFATNFGREALFSYIVAAAYALTGPGTLGIHLASALVSILTIPAVFLAGNELFQREKEGWLAQYGGLLAALVLALSFWHLIWSRYSVRAILIPLFVALLCFFLLRGWRTQRRRYFLLAGLVMGLGFYTYQLAQLFPILAALGFAYELIARRAVTRRDVGDMALVFGTAVLLALPLAFYAYQNPGVFNQRIGDVFVLKESNPLAEQARILAGHIWQVVRMYTVEGDSDPLINIPGRPSLSPFLALAFVGGVLLALWRWRRPQYLFLLTWVGLMSAPAFLAEKAAMSKRALGALPAATLLIALALLLPLDWLRRQSRQGRRWPMWTYTAVLLLGLLFTGWRSFRDLFLVWGVDPLLYTHYNVGVAEIGEYIAALPADETIYLSPTYIDHSTLKLHSGNREGIRAYNGRHCFVYPQQTSGETTYIIVPGDEGNSLPLLAGAFPQGGVSHEGYLGNGNRYFVAYQIPADAAAQMGPQQTAVAHWDDQLALLGFDLAQDTFRAGDTITLNLYLQPLADMKANYTAFLHLRGAENPATGSPVWGQVDREPCFQSYPTSWWQPGEVIRDTFDLTIAPDTPPGDYQITLGFYHWPELTRLPIVTSSQAVLDDTAVLQTIRVEP